MSANPLTEPYRQWLRNSPKEPADRITKATAAIEAFENCHNQPSITAAELAPLVEAASDPHIRVFDTGCNLLVQLAMQHPEAQACLLQMAQDKSATARFHAVAYLKPELPVSLREAIVERALSDRSFKVRQKGVERAEQFRCKHYLPRLEEMQQTETHAAVLDSLAFHIPLLRDGYLLRPAGNGDGYTLTVRGINMISSRFIRNDQYSEEFVR